LHPNTMLGKVSHDVIRECNHVGLGDDDTRALSLVNDRVRDGTRAHEGIFELDG